jgi:hypothetical protein
MGTFAESWRIRSSHGWLLTVVIPNISLLDMASATLFSVPGQCMMVKLNSSIKLSQRACFGEILAWVWMADTALLSVMMVNGTWVCK